MTDSSFNKTRYRPKATTLVEIVFYFAIVGILLSAAMIFSLQILTLNGLSSNFYDLQSDVDFITQKMTYTIHTATGVDDTGSVFDDDDGVLSLTVSEPTDSPTQFYISSNQIYMKEGTASPIQLTTNNVQADHLRFHHVTAAKTPDQIVIDGQLSPIQKDISNLQHDFPFHLSLSLRTQ